MKMTQTRYRFSLFDRSFLAAISVAIVTILALEQRALAYDVPNADGKSAFANPDHRDLLTFYAFRSPASLNWRSPRALAWSYLKNIASPAPWFHRLSFRHEIGHAAISLECSDGYRMTTSMSSAPGADLSSAVVKGGYGLAGLFQVVAGEMVSDGAASDDIRDWMRRAPKGHLAFIEYRISSETCQRVRQYLTEFKNLGVDARYGLLLDPRKKEGAGCSAFSASALEIAGLLDPEYRAQWQRTIFLPRDLVGGPWTGNHVPLFRLLLGRSAGRWSNINDPSAFRVKFWDPELMWLWIENKYFELLSSTQTSVGSNEYQPVARVKSHGLTVDRSQWATPSEPIWR